MALQVKSVYLYPFENAGPHFTDKYELVHEDHPIAILRRGFKFTMAITFNGMYQGERDIVKLIFDFGTNPNAIKGTKGVIRIDPRNIHSDIDKKKWGGGVLAETGNSLTLEVYTPPDIPVGNWKLQVETSILNSSALPQNFKYEDDIYFLFNPWHSDDLVAMPEKRYIDEYVLTDVGKIWVGPYGSSRGREWVFGQFDKCVLAAAMLMFERSGMADFSRGDPIKTTRVISKLVNSNDDDGVLVGRWDGEYDDGVAPSAWSGSVPILDAFLKKKEPVNYGQCWVFSGLCTTIARALGIPSRVVSNLVSAHDANASLSVDKYYNENNEELEYDPNNPMGEDSIWNFHVWADVWMARPDLPKGYGGWQAIDSTPQETSDGVYQCGPASLEAIKKGEVGFNYDVAFMVSSVNADLMRWKEDISTDMGYSRIYCNKYHVGRMILTKMPFMFDPNGDKDREDITLQYKALEGTQTERLSLLNAVRGTTTARMFFDVPENVGDDVEFELVDLEKINIGEDFDVTVKITNKSSEVRNIKAVLSTGSVFYTGVKASVIKKAEGAFKMQPKSHENLSMTVEADDYLDKLVEYCIMKVYAIATVDETKATWADEDDFQVVKPTIEFKIPKQIPIKKSTKISIYFNNPLKKNLTRCQFRLSGSTLTKEQVISCNDVRPGALARADVEITPKTEGDVTLVATFTSIQLQDVTGTVKVEAV